MSRSKAEATHQHMQQGAELLGELLRDIEANQGDAIAQTMLKVMPVRYKSWWEAHKRRDKDV